MLKRINKAPKSVQILFDELIDDLEEKGPFQYQWPNYSKLGIYKYHCHLYHSWVTCWVFDSKSKEIEVYYAGSRESAPY